MYMRHSSWMTLMTNCGFDTVSFATDKCMMSTVYVCRRRVTTAVTNTFVDVNDVKEFGWVEPLKTMIDDPCTSSSQCPPQTECRKLVVNMSHGRCKCIRDHLKIDGMCLRRALID